jgi:hypothetical protein
VKNLRLFPFVNVISIEIRLLMTILHLFTVPEKQFGKHECNHMMNSTSLVVKIHPFAQT